MSKYRAQINGFISTGGPFAYAVSKDGVGQTAADEQANLGVAFNAARDALVALITAEVSTITPANTPEVVITVTTNPPVVP